MEKLLFDKLKNALIDLSPGDGLKLVSGQFAGHTRFSTSFGMEDQVITHIIATQLLDVDIFTLDTGRLFQETYDVYELTKQKYKVTITPYFPDRKRVEELLRQKGPNSFYESVDNRKECCFIRKVEPLQRALANAKIWVTGLRADQSANRNSMDVIEWDEQHRLIKYNPLIHWSQQDLELFIDQNSVPVNSLHKKGFPSIGCAPCTRAILPGEDPRAGRWWWESSSKECGLHEHKEKQQATLTTS